jgi:ADP-ribose pyrophosphatase YjhB (NUDIX family)
MVGVGGVVIRVNRALLIRRGTEPLKGEWSIPGGLLELGETIAEGVRRELLEETGLEVKVIELIEVFERIFPASPPEGSDTSTARAETHLGQSAVEVTAVVPAQTEPVSTLHQGPLYHFVILDYLCEALDGEPHAGGDVTDVAFATEEELERFCLTPTATRVVRTAFALARARSNA